MLEADCEARIYSVPFKLIVFKIIKRQSKSCAIISVPSLGNCNFSLSVKEEKLLLYGEERLQEVKWMKTEHKAAALLCSFRTDMELVTAAYYLV